MAVAHSKKVRLESDAAASRMRPVSRSTALRLISRLLTVMRSVKRIR